MHGRGVFGGVGWCSFGELGWNTSHAELHLLARGVRATKFQVLRSIDRTDAKFQMAVKQERLIHVFL